MTTGTHPVRCVRSGCGWTGRRTGAPSALGYPCPRCGTLEPSSASTIVVDADGTAGGAP